MSVFFSRSLFDNAENILIRKISEREQTDVYTTFLIKIFLVKWCQSNNVVKFKNVNIKLHTENQLVFGILFQFHASGV